MTYRRKLARGHGRRLHFGLGQAGEVDAHFVAGEVKRLPAPQGCSGGPAIHETGHFVGTISLHPPGGFVRATVHRPEGLVTHDPSRVYRGRSPFRRSAAYRKRAGEILRLIAGEPNGQRHFEAVYVPPFMKGEVERTSFEASVTRRVGPLTITDSATSSPPPAEQFAIPDLADLPATATVELPAPFSGSATFELPSRRSAMLSGDLAVELPEVGNVSLTGPKIAAGVCHGFSCTKSLPQALRPKLSGTFLVSVSESSGPFEASSIK